MKTTTTYIIMFIAILLVIILYDYSVANDEKDSREVTLRIIPINDNAVRKRFWKELDKIAQRERLIVSTNQSPKEALRARCGAAPMDLQQILKKFNPGLNLDKKCCEQELTFIPCPYWAPNEKHPATKKPIRKGQPITEILRIYTGTYGDTTLKQVRKLNPTILDKNDLAIRDGVIRLPYVTNSVTFRLRDEIKENNEQISCKLAKDFPDWIPPSMDKYNKLNTGLRIRLVVQYGPQKIDTLTKCIGPDSPGKWPFNLEKIETIYNKTRKDWPGIGNPPFVLVADTGLDLSDPMIVHIKRVLWNNPSVVNHVYSRYKDDLYGPNFILNTGNIEPSKGYQYADHGTEVVKIMSGGSLAYSSALMDKFKIAVAKVTPDSDLQNITPTALGDALRYAEENGASVLNLSVLASDGGAFEDGLQGTKKFLLVVAAGNNNKSVEDDDVYPPALTGFPDRLIVVGAHDWANKITDFSNYGTLVDLLAPGCAIPIPGKDGEILQHSGTSFAAPFVAFTAALLRSYGLTSPSAIKSRILATVDFDENLVDFTRSAGRLNIENAISLNDDIIFIKDDSGKVVELHGELDPLQSWPCIKTSGSKDYSPNQVGRVVPHFPVKGKTKAAKVWTRTGPGLGALSENQCDALERVVAFRQKSDDDYTAYDWSEVISISTKLPRW